MENVLIRRSNQCGQERARQENILQLRSINLTGAESSKLEGKGVGRKAREFSRGQITMALMDFVLSLKS